MQMFGVGLLELILILILAAIVVGPERMPQVAADFARWIRRARAYGQHLTRDFNEVVSELEKEAGVSREDWKEIASVVNRHAGDVTKEIEKVASKIEESGDLDAAKAELPDNVVPFDGGHAAEQSSPAGGAPSEPAAEPQAVEDKPWFVPETPARRGRRPRE